MKVDRKDLDKNQVELSVEVSVEEMKPHLDKAALKLSQKSKIPGFRPGKAPYDLIKARVGEMAIYQEALESIINATFYQVVTEQKLITVGQPEIKVEKLAPGNPLIYKAIVPLMPEVTLGNWQTKKIDKKTVKVEEDEVKQTLSQLQAMRAQEVLVDRIANTKDKVEVDFEVSINKVIIEGGTSKKYPIILGEGRMIPGFEDKIIGLKANDEVEFDLKFPAKYMQENLAGKEAHFKVKVLGVYERKLPEIDDAFSKELGFDKAETLKKQVEENIQKDKEIKETQRLEREAIEQIIASATIGEVPEKLVDNEIHKMIHELEHNVRQQGMEMAGYLKSIKKTHDDLHKDFREQAINRIKAALVLRKLAEEEKITVEEKEIDEELKKQEAHYQGNPQALENLKNPMHRQYLANMLVNQKIIKFISEKIIN